jgi:hypothetical protein
MYGRPVQLSVTGGTITHLFGAPWYTLPLPPRWHPCDAATTATLGILVVEKYERCPCGGWRVHHFGGDGWGSWQARNSRRNGTAHSLTLH